MCSQQNTAEVGAKVEAFSIAGCEAGNMFQNAKQCAKHLKSEIQEKIGSLLVEITGNKTATMQYVNYECDIIQKYEIILEGWTHEKFVNLSKLSDALEPLQNLLDALHKGTCKFIKLSTAQQEQRHEEFNARVEAGKAEAPQPWKQRKDAGKKRPQASDDTDKENGREDSAPPAKKTRRKKRTAPTSTAVVADGADA